MPWATGAGSTEVRRTPSLLTVLPAVQGALNGLAPRAVLGEKSVHHNYKLSLPSTGGLNGLASLSDLPGFLLPDLFLVKNLGEDDRLEAAHQQ